MPSLFVAFLACRDNRLLLDTSMSTSSRCCSQSYGEVVLFSCAVNQAPKEIARSKIGASAEVEQKCKKTVKCNSYQRNTNHPEQESPWHRKSRSPIQQLGSLKLKYWRYPTFWPFCSTSWPLTYTRCVWSTIKLFWHCPLSLSSAAVDKSQQHPIFEKMGMPRKRERNICAILSPYIVSTLLTVKLTEAQAF